MLQSVINLMDESDIFIGCAAVSDYSPIDYSKTKIKKELSEQLDIQLKKNKDILSIVAEKFKTSYIVGFAAETSNVEENAKDKLTSKKLDMIISNDVSNKSIGFDVGILKIAKAVFGVVKKLIRFKNFGSKTFSISILFEAFSVFSEYPANVRIR